jgi:hypothetical protein
VSTSDQSATPPTTPEPPGWTEADLAALFVSDTWFALKAPRELLAQYKGMHVAIVGEQIIDADRDQKELCRRLDSKSGIAPTNRVLLRYVPTDEEALRFRY